MGGLCFHLSGRASSHAPLHQNLSGVRAASTAYTNMLPVCLSLRSGKWGADGWFEGRGWTGMDARWLKGESIWIGAHRRQRKSGESLRGEAAAAVLEVEVLEVEVQGGIQALIETKHHWHRDHVGYSLSCVASSPLSQSCRGVIKGLFFST